MRWDDLFADLEGELDAADAAQLRSEVSERTRLELAQVQWADRLDPSARVTVRLLGGACVAGAVCAVGDGWAALASGPAAAGSVTLVHLPAVLSVQGLTPAARPPGRSDVARRLGFAAALRRVSRDRSAVAVTLVDGTRVVGTVDTVGADHLDLAEHPADEPRRAARVSRLLTLPLPAVAVVAAVGESSWA